MKKYLPILFASFLCISTQAQITITKNDMPGQNDTIRYSNVANNTAINYDTTGAGITWDFSMVKPQSQGLYEYKSALLINPVYLPFFGLTAYGLKMADTIPLGVVNIYDVYSFYKNSNTKFIVEGTGMSFNGIPTPQNYSDVDEVYQFPLDYSNRDSSTYAVSTDLGGIFTYSQSGYRINEAEGWGTIKTPFGTFNALKIKTTIVEKDTLTNSSLPFPIPFGSTRVEYKWLTNGEKIPVFQVSGTLLGNNFRPNQIRYRDRFIDSLNLEVPVADFIADKTNCFLDDTVQLTNLTTPNDTFEHWQWAITPNTFNYLNGTGSTSNHPTVQFIAAGKYTVRLTASNHAGTNMRFKPQYITVTMPSGIDNTPKKWLQVYPNPATSSIEINAIHIGDNIQIFDVTGKLVKEFKANQTVVNIDLRELAPGMYMLKVGNRTFNLVKN